MIEVRGIRQGVLEIASLDIPPGSTAVIGKNGSGKTTLLKVLAGITRPESGTVLVDGKSPGATDIGWLNEYPDKNMLFGRVFDEIASPLRFSGVPCDAVRERVRALSDRLGIGRLLERTTRDLSGGEKVLTALATALITDPSVLVMDEVDSHLDEYSTRLIMTLPASLALGYRIWCTQDMDLAARSDYVLLLDRGSVAGFGTPRTIFPGLAGDCLYPFSWRCRDEKTLL
jgi:energy-coupling factor transport system ATP-binding protein